MKYEVYNLQTGYSYGEYASKQRARRKADKLDLEYGAIRYGVRELCKIGGTC